MCIAFSVFISSNLRRILLCLYCILFNTVSRTIPHFCFPIRLQTFSLFPYCQHDWIIHLSFSVIIPSLNLLYQMWYEHSTTTMFRKREVIDCGENKHRSICILTSICWRKLYLIKKNLLRKEWVLLLVYTFYTLNYIIIYVTETYQ